MSTFVDEPDDFIDDSSSMSQEEFDRWAQEVRLDDSLEPADLETDAWVDWGGEG